MTSPSTTEVPKRDAIDILASWQSLLAHCESDPQFEGMRHTQIDFADLRLVMDEMVRLRSASVVNVPDGLHWQTDEFGAPDRALYLGPFNIGHVSQVRVGGPYRAWLMTDESGQRVGKDMWETEEDAKKAVFDEAFRLLAALKNGERPYGVIGYVNVYRDKDGEIELGLTDLLSTPGEVKPYASDFMDHVETGVVTLLKSTIPDTAHQVGSGDDAGYTHRKDCLRFTHPFGACNCEIYPCVDIANKLSSDAERIFNTPWHEPLATTMREISNDMKRAVEALRADLDAKPDVNAGWIIGNGKNPPAWRAWHDGPVWRHDRALALRFARRIDAEEFAKDDEDAWQIIPFASSQQKEGR